MYNLNMVCFLFAHTKRIPGTLCTITTKPTGKVIYRRLGLKHREDGPAVINANGDQYYYRYGELHRTNGPAIIKINGHKEWFCHGRRHRVDGPAMEYANGARAWFYNGGLHRGGDMPAVITSNGDQEWFVENKRHRTNGPAVVYVNGATLWYRRGKLHREGGPAVVDANGVERWYCENRAYLMVNLQTTPANESGDAASSGYVVLREELAVMREELAELRLTIERTLCEDISAIRSEMKTAQINMDSTIDMLTQPTQSINDVNNEEIISTTV